MGIFKAFELVFGGVILLIVLFAFLAGAGGVLFEVIDNATAVGFGMGGASKLMIGLIGFIMSAALIYAGVREALTPEDRSQYYGPGGYQ